MEESRRYIVGCTDDTVYSRLKEPTHNFLFLGALHCCSYNDVDTL